MTVPLESYTSVAPIAGEWDGLADRVGAAPFLRPGWIAAWWDAFGAGTFHVVARRDDGRLAGVLPFVRRARGVHAPVNWHTPLFGAVAVDTPTASELYAEAAASRPPYASLRFLDAGDEGAVSGLRARGYRVTVRPLLDSPYLPLGGGWESLPRKREKEMEKRLRKLDALGGVELDVQDGSVNLERLTDEGFAIEGSGWKTEQGTAILSRPDTHAFYTAIARWAAGRGILRLFFLRCGGRAIAFELGLVDNGSYFFVKGGYDPEFRKYAPGLVLMHEIIRWSCDNGLQTFEFLGAPDQQKLEWTSLARERVAVEAFAPSAAGRVAQLAHEHGRPLARRGSELVRAIRRRGT